MEINIREELKSDYEVVEKLTEEAFKNAEHSDGSEHLLVKRLRSSDSFIEELSLVAECDGKIVGHCLLTKGKIKSGDKYFETLALAPVSVSPKYQNKAIGSKLIEKALEKARKLGYGSVIVLGHDKYYPRFGFRPASSYEITAPFEVPNEAFMAIELTKGALSEVSGVMVYAKEFFE